ncbi:hypothetical protein [Parapusillimonas granuli]|uniref:DUF2783 domain-containing protein n=1 Tax=Parapusillimonas granuli TaxID=380911 RepID=A0A853FQP6_9BURK|nr:hypothetical protein [Parapusillimonas granuli]MBB5216560.1 hypothetical protein [Parapusillimonas granuli]MEB2399697.1 hypothetical protein [Alcaligenaceae bacterium]NYT48134.1 hypothetical protein [Parapusillimonas granuli]
MTELDLDRVYTKLCHTLGELGEGAAAGMLSRFALLAMLEIGDADKIEALIERAALST